MKIGWRAYLLLGVCFITSFTINGQPVQINEALAVNSNFLDEDGEASDWIELFNNMRQDIDLSGWTMTDDIGVIDKWTFPDFIMEANSYLLIWASGKDRRELTYYRSLIKEGDEFSFINPTESVDDDWITLNFNDLEWENGLSGFGYGDDDDTTILEKGTQSVFLRKKFNVSDVGALEALVFDIDYDDGFVAYINGVEIARELVNGIRPEYNARAIENHEATLYGGGQPERFVIENPDVILQNGENILAVQVHNVNPSSSDLTAIPFLTGVYERQSFEGSPTAEVLDLKDQLFHTNFKLAAEKETVYVFTEAGVLADSLFLAGEFSDISIGRDIVEKNIVYYDMPSPGSENVGTPFEGVIETEINFSHDGGATGTFDLELTTEQTGGVIRYTSNSTIPVSGSASYEGPIRINKNSVIRARYFKDGFISSNTDSRAYMINVKHDLPIISLITAPGNLFDIDNGIYVRGRQASSDFPYFGANFWEDWERPVHFSFYETDGEVAEMTNAGIKIFGGWSRGFDQRSFSLFARKEYGKGKFKHLFFPELEYSSFESLVLRNSGNDWSRTMLRDGTLTSLMKGADLEFQAYRPTVVYLNGEYYGIYNLREKVNEHFLASKKKSILIVLIFWKKMQK